MFGKITFKLLLLSFIAGVVFSSPLYADISIVSSTTSGLQLSYTTGEILLDSLYVDATAYTTIDIAHHTTSAESGYPALPTRTIIFASPQGSIPSVNVSPGLLTTKQQIRVSPVPRIMPDGSGMTVETYDENPSAYAMSGYLPESFAVLGSSDDRSGLTFWELHLYPVLFDAASSKIVMSETFTISISFPGGGNAAADSKIPGYVLNRDVFIPKDFSISRKLAAETDSPFSTGAWYKITVSETGMYKISGDELLGAGFPHNSVSVDNIRMYYGGGLMLPLEPYDISTDSFREIAITVNDVDNDGLLDAFDSIVFYGQDLNRYEINNTTGTPLYQNYTYADADRAENVYWLAIRNDSTPKRIEPAGETPDSGLGAITHYRERFHIEQENYFDYIDNHGQEAGTDWYWDTIAGVTKTFSFNAPGFVSIERQYSKIRFWFLRGLYVTDDSINKYYDHYFEVTLNNDNNLKYFISALIDDKEIETINTNAILKETNNLIDIRRTETVANQHARLDWIEIEYNRSLSFHGSGFEYFQPGSASPLKFTLSNANESVVVYDTSDRYEPKRVQTVSASDASLAYQVTVPSGKYGRFTIWDSTEFLSVSSITQKQFENLRDPSIQANHIIISHADFLSEAERLSAYRNRQELTSIAVDVEDVYDEFSWGVYDPAAIRDYLQYMWEVYDPENDSPFYACLIGDTTFKYKNISEEILERNFLPTHTISKIDTSRTNEETITTDDFFGWFGEHYVPDISIGRLCPSDREEARIIIDKIIDYEQSPEAGPWKNRVLLVADDNYAEKGAQNSDNFVTDTEEVEEYIPANFERDKIYLIEYEFDNNFRKPEASEDLISAMNDGYLLVNFSGHGNNDVITHEEIFRGSRDIELVNNGNSLPLYLFFSCAVGRFDRVESTALSEMLQVRDGGGAIAVVAASRVTYQSLNNSFNKSFLSSLFDSTDNPELRLGIAMQQSKKIESAHKNTYKYIFFGDPATRLMIPRYSFSVASIDTIMRLQKLDLEGSVSNNGEPVTFSGKLYVKAQGPNTHKSYPLNTSSVIEYSMPGKTFYTGELDLDSSDFNISFVVPKDLTSDISFGEYQKESRILFYAQGNSDDASGVLTDFLIGDIDPDAANDTTPPEITMKLDGTTVQDGSRIRSQPTMTLGLYDESGINTIGNRGHNLKLTIDQTDVVMLTDEYVAENGYTTGTISYDLPLLSNGEHELEVSVFDTYNNVAKKSVTVEVTGSETGDLSIENLLNYPNPMTTEGTSFTFDLNDDVRSASIKVYSQSGRLVDTVRFSAQYGFNQIHWKPSVILANGVYFYKLSVISMNGRKSSKIEKLVVMR